MSRYECGSMLLYGFLDLTGARTRVSPTLADSALVGTPCGTCLVEINIDFVSRERDWQERSAGVLLDFVVGRAVIVRFIAQFSEQFLGECGASAALGSRVLGGSHRFEERRASLTKRTTMDLTTVSSLFQFRRDETRRFSYLRF